MSNKTTLHLVCFMENCKLKLRAVNRDEGTYFQVRSFVNEHTCPLEEIHRRHRQASAVIIGEVIAPRLQQQDGRLMRLKDIITDMKSMYGSKSCTGRFGGTMFVATAQDGNEQVYPIAFGYGDSENNLSWEWFLDCLKGALGHIEELVFISDRHVSIEAGISKVFPYATHTICCWHFPENIKKRLQMKDVASIKDKAVHAYTEERNLDLTTLCSDYYKRQTLIDGYLVPIILVGHPSTWVVPSDIAQRVILNPISRRQAGGRGRVAMSRLRKGQLHNRVQDVDNQSIIPRDVLTHL
ncbi:hypothetical protein Ddye_012973 [Dipteronia dyeriana]|uniref:MULE transposase domain-containing protein n=1 Tax=Dipteronia dyeriana TaxID=168575 RepID=A0AAD9X5J3_9ROSI|nr:hypothetical protein Ddye_012973 [Dipteronia dyeriana]